MKYNIKSILFSITIGSFLFSCNTANDAGLDAPEITPKNEPAGIQMNSEQINMAGIEFGTPEKRFISNYIECSGKAVIPPNSLASVYSAINGFIGEVKWLPGDYVKKGSILTTLKHPEIIRLQSNFLESKSQLEFKKSVYQRKKELVLEDATSQKALDQAKVDFETEQVRFNGLKAELKLNGLPADVIEKQNQIQPVINIYAPISGFITIVNVNKGKLVDSEDLLFEMMDDRKMLLELQVYAKDLAQIKKGQHIEASLPGTDEIITAEVSRVGQMIDLTTKTTTVFGNLKQKPASLTAGTFFQAKIFDKGVEVIAIPESAILRRDGDSFVFVQQNEIFKKVIVRTGRSDMQFTQIEDLNLKNDEKLVIKGGYYINGSDSGE